MKLTNRLSKKFLSSILMATILPGIVGMSLSLWVARDIIYHIFISELQSTVQIYAEAISPSLGQDILKIPFSGVLPSGSAVERVLSPALRENNHIDIVRGDGRVMWDSLGSSEVFSGEEMKKLSESNTGWLEMEGKHGQSFVGVFSKIELATPLAGKNDKTHDWYLSISRQQNVVLGTLLTFFIKVAIPSFAVIVLIAIAWYYMSNRFFIQPVMALYSGIQAVKGGYLEHKVEVKTGDEIQDVAEEFNAMVLNLKGARVRIEEILLRDEKRAVIGTLAAGIAHELNNPLTAVIGYAESIQKRVGQGELDKEAVLTNIQKIQAAGWRCAKIIEALKSYARERPAESQEEDVNELIRASLLLVSHQFKSWSTIEIVEELAVDLPRVYCDRNKIQQVMINLLVNARDAMPGGGKITIRTKLDKGGSSVNDKAVIIEVADIGEGIPPEVMAQIFDPFFTTKPVGQGTGLGLSICQSFIAAHGGVLDVTSEVGTGTTFSIRLNLCGNLGNSEPSGSCTLYGPGYRGENH